MSAQARPVNSRRSLPLRLVYAAKYAAGAIERRAIPNDYRAMLTLDEVRFTHRQREVVHLIATGCSNVEIANRLGISPRTAKAHADALRTKLGVARRRQLPAAYRAATGEDPHDLPPAGQRTGGDSSAASSN